MIGENEIFEGFYLLVQRLHRLEVAVHDVVQQPVHQEPHPALGELGCGVPPPYDLFDVEVLVFADGDQSPRGNERGHLVLIEHPGAGVQAHSVGGQERVGVVAVELGPLVLMDRVLHRELMQAQLLADGRQVFRSRGTHVQPHCRGRITQIVRNFRRREVLGFQDTVAVQTSARHTRRR